MEIQKIILSYLSKNIRHILDNISKKDFETLQEIRIRINQPLMISKKNTDYFITAKGECSKNAQDSYITTSVDIKESLQLMSEYSIYAFEEELKNGFITLPGGHRVGIVGKAVVEDRKIKTLKHISGFNIRICHEIVGCSNEILPYIIEGNSIYHTLIISPPMCGKTTILRDIIRQISTGIPGKFEGVNVGVVDERSEIAGCYKGIPQNHVGLRTDVLDGCPKEEGILILLRAMSPRVIAIDELGKKEEVYALWNAINSGVKILATVHGASINEILKKPVFSQMIKESLFERIVILSKARGPGTISSVLEGETQRIIYERR